jgi:hypothetical protein
MMTSRLASHILSYLTKHPRAQDTLEGIVEWWVLEQGVEQRVVAVKDALAKLVAQGSVLQGERPDGRVYYKLNQSMRGGGQSVLSIQANHHGPTSTS